MRSPLQLLGIALLSLLWMGTAKRSLRFPGPGKTMKSMVVRLFKVSQNRVARKGTPYLYKEFNEQGSEVKIIQFDPSGKQVMKVIKEYDLKGYLSEERHYSASNPEPRVFHYVREYRGQLLRKVKQTDPEGNTRVWTYEYTPRGEKEEKIYKNGGLREIRIYNGKGWIREAYYNSDKSREYYRYDNAGNLLQRTQIYPDGREVSKFENKYNRDGKLVEVTFEGEVETRYRYGTTGNKTEEIHYANGNVYQVLRFHYTYW